MKKTFYVLLVLVASVFFVSCGNSKKSDENTSTDEQTTENTEENEKIVELTDAELIEFLWETPQKGWIKEGYDKDNFYYICFGVEYEDHTKPAIMDIYDSESPAKGIYDWSLTDGKVHAIHKYDESEIDLEIAVIGDEKIMINNENYIPLSNKEASDLQSN